MFNHLEYDSDTLHNEYIRDLSTGQDVDIPLNYYPDNDPNKRPMNSWRGNGHLLFSNWVNFLYQTTPFLLEDIGKQVLLKLDVTHFVIGYKLHENGNANIRD